MPKKSTPTCSARTPSSTTLRIVWACDSGWPSTVLVRSPKVSSPSTSGNAVRSSPAAIEFVGWSVMSGAPSVVLFGETQRLLLFGGAVDGTLEVLAAQHYTEHRATGLQYPAGAEWSYRDGVVADAVDECTDGVYGVGIVACDTEGAPIHRAGGPGIGLELVITDMVEGFDNRGIVEPFGDDLAGPDALVVEGRPKLAVGGRPVVHRVDH